MGISCTALIDYENGGAIPDTFAKKLQERFNMNDEWFIKGTGKMLLHDTEDTPENQQLENAHEGYKVPLLNQRVSCGDGANWEDEQNIESYIDVFSMIPQYKLGRLFALSVQGNSMIGAGIKNGDYVLFCTGDDPVLDDDIYVFSLDREVFCKQLKFDIISKKNLFYPCGRFGKSGTSHNAQR
jgi:phage repressor protein C with HTH and peptisase S24 domain